MQKKESPVPAAPAKAAVKPGAKAAARRRVPQQERGIKTIEVILKAAGREIARGGLGKLTTKRIAEAAGLSVGGLYEYFPNKEAVVHALASQWLQEVKGAVAAIHPAQTGCSDLIRYLGMVYAAVKPFYQQVPGVSVLVTLLSSVPELKALENDIDRQVKALLTDAISFLLPHVDPDHCGVMARTVTILDHHLLIESTLRDPAHAALFENHRLVCNHALASYMMLLNEQARQAAGHAAPRSDPPPASWPAPRPEAPPDVT
nr:TetR/AcrR family transcriptional regulator [uncultured Janthinobacterium sp.]